MNKLVVIILAATIFAYCGDSTNYIPKPKTFPRIDFPQKAYKEFNPSGNPYSFEIPVYSSMDKDASGVYTLQPYWYNLNFKPFNATLHLTYHRFENFNVFDSLLYNTRKLVKKHIQKAEDIEEVKIQTYNSKLRGVFFNIEGNTATNLNFYITDSSHQFIRGALYFNQKTTSDSIAPVFQYMKKDVEHLIKTFKWN